MNATGKLWQGVRGLVGPTAPPPAALSIKPTAPTAPPDLAALECSHPELVLQAVDLLGGASADDKMNLQFALRTDWQRRLSPPHVKLLVIVWHGRNTRLVGGGVDMGKVLPLMFLGMGGPRCH